MLNGEPILEICLVCHYFKIGKCEGGTKNDSCYTPVATGFLTYIGPEERRYLNLDHGGETRPEEHGQEWEGYNDDGPEEDEP